MNDNSSGSQLLAYSDANWAEDTTDRKSTSGYYCSLNGGTISWCSRKQDVIALSSCEAEYVALAETCKEVIWLREVVKAFDEPVDERTIIYTDSQSCIGMIDNQKFSNRTKHIDVKYHFIRKMVKERTIELIYVRTDENIADLMTKPLGPTKTTTLRKMAGMEAVNESRIEEEC
jgi:transposase-like protein